jgi:hypothetical protein
VKKLAQFTVQQTLGVDMSAFLPDLCWWTVFSDELSDRHHLDVTELAAFSRHSERWFTEDHTGLNAFRLYDSPDDWEQEKGRISTFLETHSNFFSMTRIATLLDEAETKEQFDEATCPYWAGAVPWESTPNPLNR